MYSKHNLVFEDARRLVDLAADSIELVVTSPPYPMVEMWDTLFINQNPEIGCALKQGDHRRSFELMHRVLDEIWNRLPDVMSPGSFACINIGDATRTVKGSFQLFPNHARILKKFMELGFDVLPAILWRKPTNVPNKFMGSGMLPAGAYVTLEHEYILIFRKGGIRRFSTDQEKQNRLASALFWEERNSWYSDLWDFKGVKQGTDNLKLRERSAAFPVLLPFRLINMYSVFGDTVLDPFLGTGTTVLASMAAGRNSLGYEIDVNFSGLIRTRIHEHLDCLNELNRQRINRHLNFVNTSRNEKRPFKYKNKHYNFPVMTRQEVSLKLPLIKSVDEVQENSYLVTHTVVDESLDGG